jgi:integrase
MRDGSIRPRKRRRYKPSVVRSYERALGLLPEQRERAPERLLERLGDDRLADLDRRDVQAYANRLLANGWGAATVHNQLDPLRVIVRRARDRDELATDPTERLDLPDREGTRDRIPDPDEAARLIDRLPEVDRALWATAFYAGLRRGELRALRWRDVDLAAGVIRVRRGWDDVEGEQDVKSAKSRRDVPIVGALRQLLRDHQMASGRRASDLVFGLTEAAPFVPSSVRKRALDAWDGLETYSLHEARHCFASIMSAAGVPIKDVSEWMGHASIAITADRYGHLFRDAHERAVEKVDSFLGAASQRRLREV